MFLFLFFLPEQVRSRFTEDPLFEAVSEEAERLRFFKDFVKALKVSVCIMRIHTHAITWALQCRLARAKSHTSQERKIRHIHCGVGKAVSIHSVAIPYSSIDIDLSGPAFTK